MATRAAASAVFPIPVEKVWSAVRDFTFPGKLLPSVIASAKIVQGASAFEVGAVREVKWKSGEVKKQRLIELSDQYRRITWETIEAEPPTETSAAITTVKLVRITETNGTLVEWSSDFSADVNGSLITFEQKAYLDSLSEMRKVLASS